MLFLIECKISVKASTDVIYVPDHYPTIQDAINHASDGDTIFVRARTYYENVVVNKSISLVGENRDSTIIDGSNKGSVISIKANNVNISGFTIRHSGNEYSDSGIYVDHSSGNKINSNSITSNSAGISLYYSGSNVISGNTISLNNYDGIVFYSSSSNIVSDNSITSNNGGISLYYSGSNVISGNTISLNNYDGIVFYYSGNNMVFGNTISLNNNYGMYLALYSDNNIIYFNNFNNAFQAWSDSKNVWDNRKEGNYWSDYTGVDLYSGPNQNETGSDGIGDTPYKKIDKNNVDNYPLMGMFSYFTVTFEGKTYYVTIICNSTVSEFRFEVGPETGNRIVRFDVSSKGNTVGFCRITVPTGLMSYPYIVLVGAEEIVPTLLDISNDTYAYLYFTYIHGSQTVTIISSKTLRLYNELYSELLDKHVKLQMDLHNLNVTYHDFLANYSILLGNYSQLQEDYQDLFGSYQKHLLDYTENVRNIRNLMYVFAATTAIFLITTIYLSKHAHTDKTRVRNLSS